MRFNDMSIEDGTKDAVAAMGYEEATPIQRDAIPHLVAGRDLIGRAQTGTGKTAAFGIPIIDALRAERRNAVVALVLVPTRELALQVTDVLTDIAKGSRLSIIPVFGGTGFDKQTRLLSASGSKIVVACPGRLLDLEGRGQIDLSTIQELVLDEADRMLDMGFIHDMRRVLRLVPVKRRTSLWSATISREIKQLAGDFLNDPVTVEVETPTTATELTDQYVMMVEKSAKPDTLLALLHEEQPDKAVVFTRTKHLAKRLAQKLDKTGWASVALQGNMTQGQRERAMDAFRTGAARILVATDVAARGLDVPDVTHVVNFDIPNEPESYVHRIGRTGRNGRTGRSFTFVQSDQHTELRDVERTAGLKLTRHKVELDGVEVRGPDQPVALPKPQGQNPPRAGGPQGGHRRKSSAGRGPAHNQGGQGQGGPRRNGRRRAGQGQGGHGGQATRGQGARRPASQAPRQGRR